MVIDGYAQDELELHYGRLHYVRYEQDNGCYSVSAPI